MGRQLRFCQRNFGFRCRLEYEDVQEPDRIEDQPYNGDPSIGFYIGPLLGLGVRHRSPLSKTTEMRLLQLNPPRNSIGDRPTDNNALFIVPKLINPESIILTGTWCHVFLSV